MLFEGTLIVLGCAKSTAKN